MERSKRKMSKPKIVKYVQIYLKKMNEHMRKNDNNFLSMLLMENAQNKFR